MEWLDKLKKLGQISQMWKNNKEIRVTNHNRWCYLIFNNWMAKILTI